VDNMSLFKPFIYSLVRNCLDKKTVCVSVENMMQTYITFKFIVCYDITMIYISTRI